VVAQAFSVIVHDAQPSALDLKRALVAPAEEVLHKAFGVADEVLGVSRLLSVSDFLGSKRVDERSIILYVAKLKQAHDDAKKQREVRTHGERVTRKSLTGMGGDRD
jgi:hypothetical protein